MVASVSNARDRGVLASRRPFVKFTPHGVVWPDNAEMQIDAVIWCTGFTPALQHRAGLGLIGANGRIAATSTRSREEPRLWLVDDGEWTGFASATLVGVMRSARQTAVEIEAALAGSARVVRADACAGLLSNVNGDRVRPEDRARGAHQPIRLPAR